MGHLDGRRVLVTGAGDGLGAAYARLAAAEGAAVLVNDLNAELASRTADGINETGGHAVPFAGDVSDWDSAASIVDACVSELGGIDGLINNAGILGFVRPIHEEQINARRTIEVNVLGVLYVAAHATRRMVDAGNGGSIVNASSGAQCGLEHQGTYSASKGAVSSFTYSWSRDLQAHGIRVNAISPNATTNQQRELIEQVGYNPEENHGEYPTLEDNAALAIFLLSDCSRKLNGQVVRIEHGAINVMSHPLMVEPRAEIENFSVDAISQAFENSLFARLQPVGVASAEVRPNEVVL